MLYEEPAVTDSRNPPSGYSEQGLTRRCQLSHWKMRAFYLAGPEKDSLDIVERILEVV